jgi:hypothetical protein
MDLHHNSFNYFEHLWDFEHVNDRCRGDLLKTRANTDIPGRVGLHKAVGSPSFTVLSWRLAGVHFVRLGVMFPLYLYLLKHVTIIRVLNKK